MRQTSIVIMILIVLSLARPQVVTAVITDVGDVIIGEDGTLVVGNETFGQRTINSEADGPYPSVIVGHDVGAEGELLLTNNASLTTPGALIVAAEGTELGQRSGFVHVSGGSSLNTGSAALAQGAGGGRSAEVIVEGLGSTWTNEGKLGIGEFFTTDFVANVKVLSGGFLSTNGATLATNIGGAATRSRSIVIEGAGSTWINTGLLHVRGEGALFTIREGGFASDAEVSLGSAFSEEKAVIDGPGSRWETGPMLMITRGLGLAITNGGQVHSESVLLTTQTHETVLIDGDGSRWDIDGNLLMGGNGAGGNSFIIVNDGGRLTAGNVFMRIPTGFSGITVQGTDSEFISVGDLVLQAPDLGGVLLIEDGGLVSNKNAVLSCSGFGPACTADVRGPGTEWKSSGSLYIGGDQDGAFLPGKLTVSDRAHVTVGDTLKVWMEGEVLLDDGTIRADLLDLDGGLLAGEGLIDGDVLNGGTVRLDGLLGIIGNYMQRADAELEIDLGGTTPVVEYDVLTVLGDSVLFGDIVVSLTGSADPDNPFMPAFGDTFYPLLAKTIDIADATFLLPDLTDGLFWETAVVGLFGNDEFAQALQLRVSSVPEPSFLLLLASGLAGLLGWTRCRRGNPWGQIVGWLNQST